MNEFNLRNITYTYHTKFDFSSFSRFSYVIIYSYMSALGYKKNTNVCFCRRWSWIHLCSHILFVVLDSSEIFHFITHRRVVSLNAKHLFKYAGLDVDKWVAVVFVWRFLYFGSDGQQWNILLWFTRSFFQSAELGVLSLRAFSIFLVIKLFSSIFAMCLLYFTLIEIVQFVNFVFFVLDTCLLKVSVYLASYRFYLQGLWVVIQLHEFYA